MGEGVYVVTACEHGEQKECIVLSNVFMALRVHEILSNIYGGVNVAMASRKIDDIPANISREINQKGETQK